jgi:hypothetical protein
MSPQPNQLKVKIIQLGLLLLSIQQGHALVLYPGDNQTNITAPASEAPFYAVARVCDNGGGSTAGSAVYIRGKYLLTANHVSNRDYLTFDGVNYFARDTAFTPIKIGTADLKLIKLLQDPGLAAVPLHTSASGHDTSYTITSGPNRGTVDITGTLIGWGLGTAADGSGFEQGSDQTWNWGSTSTLAKRWGTNRIDFSLSITGIPDYNYSYIGLSIDLDRNAGNNEAGLATYDSGSAIFVETTGTWTLAGIATLVETASSSTFSDSGDLNYFVRISSLATEIEAAIPDTETYSGWKVDYSLYDNAALDTADEDGDGLALLHEFAFGGDPTENDPSRLPIGQLIQDTGNTYLEISYTRPSFDNGLNYTPQTTSDLTTWPTDSSGVALTATVDNGNGTQTLTYRRSLPIDQANQAFMRIEVSH